MTSWAVWSSKFHGGNKRDSSLDCEFSQNLYNSNRMLKRSLSSSVQPRHVETRLLHAGSYDQYSRAGFVQESAFCLQVRIKNYTGYHEAERFPFVPYPMLLVWCMWFDKQSKPDQPAKPNKQALLSTRATYLSHRCRVISSEHKGTLRATKCWNHRGAAF